MCARVVYACTSTIPRPGDAGMTHSPSFSEVTAFPTLLTTPTPSLPAIAGNWGLSG